MEHSQICDIGLLKMNFGRIFDIVTELYDPFTERNQLNQHWYNGMDKYVHPRKRVGCNHSSIPIFIDVDAGMNNHIPIKHWVWLRIHVLMLVNLC